MIFRLHRMDVDTLLGKKETGMGYQVVSAVSLNNFVTLQYVVYNSELAIIHDQDFDNNKRSLLKEGYSRSLERATLLSLKASSIQVLTKDEAGMSPTVLRESSGYRKRHLGVKGAKDNPTEYANGIEIFVRLSAYENDRRIDFENKKLLPGSYTTTEVDYNDCVNQKDDPIDRYALPNDEPTKWTFYIKPIRTDTLQRGIVQPAFGHLGGGIEAYFSNGTSNGTFYQKREYGR